MISPSAFRQESELYRLVRTSVDARTATETFLLCPYRRIILHLYNPLRTQIDTFSATRTRSVYVKSSCPPSVHVYRSRYVTEDVHKDVFLDTDILHTSGSYGPGHLFHHPVRIIEQMHHPVILGRSEQYDVILRRDAASS